MQALAGTGTKPTSAQHAALRILLEDVEPLLQRAEEAASTLAKAHEDLHGDLERLGALVQRTTDAQPALLEAGRKLAGSAARIETAMPQAPPPTVALPLNRGWPAAMVAACAASAALSALAVSGVQWVATREMAEQARIGRALQLAWPTLDAATRVKVREVIER
jgi:hypothetical protein